MVYLFLVLYAIDDTVIYFQRQACVASLYDRSVESELIMFQTSYSFFFLLLNKWAGKYADSYLFAAI